jgi:WD40 repeat protein
VFVTGQSTSATSSQYATVAYNAATGAQRWVRRYKGPGNLSIAHAVAVSPGGRTVFVTGESLGATSGRDYATIAYNAATGAQRWVRRYNAPANRGDVATAVTVSPGGRTVFVTGQSHGAASDYDYATVAYRVATGARRWVSRYNGPGNGSDIANAVAVSAGGRTVFVTGASQATSDATSLDYATIAYSAATGAPRWVRRYNGPFRHLDLAASLAVSPRGGAVFVTGFSQRARTRFSDYATVGYDAATGAQLWARRYSGPDMQSRASSVAVSPDGAKVFVTGTSVGVSTGEDYAMVAYRG